TDDPEAHGRTVRRLDVVSVEAHLDPAVLTGATPEVDRALARLAHDALATVVEPAALAELAAVHERAVARLADLSWPFSAAVRDRSTRRVARLFFRYTDRIDVLCHVSGPSEEDEPRSSSSATRRPWHPSAPSSGAPCGPMTAPSSCRGPAPRTAGSSTR